MKWENIVRSRSEDIVGFIRNYERNLLEKLEESRDRELTMIQPDVD